MASLLKLPLLVGGYKLAEVEPRILQQQILYTGTPDLYNEQNFIPQEKLEINKKYTLQELMKRAIIYSDNTAAQLVADYYQSGFLDRILQALGIQFRLPDGTNENLSTPRTYANVFRILYNGSYLTPKYSDEVLSTLSQVAYKNGAIAKLPPDVVVAHKFAERSIRDEKTGKVGVRQLHECGIVYGNEGKEPYIFCIMIEGQEFSNLEEIQQDVSLSIYKAVLK